MSSIAGTSSYPASTAAPLVATGAIAIQIVNARIGQIMRENGCSRADAKANAIEDLRPMLESIHAVALVSLWCE